MFKAINIDNFKKSLKNAFTRVPLSVLISLVTFVLLLTRIGLNDELSRSTENLIDKGILTLSVFFFFSIGVYLLSESLALNKTKKWLHQVATAVFAALYYFSFEENLFQDPHNETIVYIFMTFVGIIAFVFFAPFILDLVKKQISQRKLYVFSYNLLIKTLMAIIAGFATMILGFIALSAVFTLFNLGEVIDQGNMFARWASFAFTLFAPIFFLTNLPSLEINKDEKIQDNKFYSFLINYIGLPAITIYFIILYSYTIKVLINFSVWPQGEVAWMVIGFSFFAYLIYFASYIFTEKLKAVQIFRNFSPVLVLVQTLMLFYAIFLRINQYDFTINRYLVVSFGTWLFFISIYFIFSKKKYLGTIFYSLVVMILLISIGPWSVYALPENRQLTKLKQYLEEAKMLDNNKVSPLEKYDDISAELSGQIYGAIEYLCSFHGCDTLNNLFAKEIAEIKKQNKIDFEKQKERKIARIKNREDVSKEKKEEMIKDAQNQRYQEMRHWSIISELSAKIKVQKYYNKENALAVPQFFIYNLAYNKRTNDSFEISGYDYYMELKSDFNLEFLDDQSEGYYEESYHSVLDSKNEKLFIYYGALDKIVENREKFIVETFSLTNEFKQILEKFKDREGESGQTNYIEIDNSNDLTFDLAGENFDARLQLYKVSIKNPEWEEVDENKYENSENGRELLPEVLKLESINMPMDVFGRVLLKVKYQD